MTCKAFFVFTFFSPLATPKHGQSWPTSMPWPRVRAAVRFTAPFAGIRAPNDPWRGIRHTQLDGLHHPDAWIGRGMGDHACHLGARFE